LNSFLNFFEKRDLKFHVSSLFLSGRKKEEDDFFLGGRLLRKSRQKKGR